MKKHLFFICTLFLIVIGQSIYAQTNIKVKVKSVAVLSALDCDAGSSDNSDFVFEYKVSDNSPFAYSNNSPVSGSIGMCNYAVVNENNGPYNLTPSSPGLAVFSPTSGVFFDRSYNCVNQIPSSLMLTWSAYENDDATVPSITPIANGTISPQALTFTIPTSNGTYTAQFTQTSSDGACPQTYMIEFEVHKTIGTFSPLSINFIDGNIICTGASNGALEASFIGGSGTVLVDWSVDGLGDYNDNTNISGVSAGTYTLVIKDALNCTDTGVVVINEINPPVNFSSFTISSATVCASQIGVNYAVASQTNAVFFWNYSGAVGTINGTGNNISIDFGNAPATGTLSVFAQNSCSTTPTLTMSVNVLAAPNVSVSGVSSMCDNSQETLTASGASTYVWNTGANTSTIAITPTVTTVYSVTGTDANGCSALKQYTMNVQLSPMVQVNVPTVAVCPNQTIAVSATGSGNLFIWSDGHIGATNTLSASANTIYTVTNTYTNSCYTQLTFTLNILQGPSLAISGNTLVCDKSFANLTASGANSFVWNNGVTTNTNSFIVSNSMSVSVVGTASNGCVDSLVQNIVMVPSPIVTISGNDTICEGGSANLVASSTGTVTYSWNSGAITPSITVSPVGTFTYSVIAFNGACGDTATHEVYVALLPTVDFIINSTPICNNGPVLTLTATPSGGVFSGTGVTSNIFNPSVGAGNYPITYSVNASGSCAVSQTQTISVMVCSGIDEQNKTNELVVFPNPTTTDITVKSDSYINFILIYDYSGKLVKIIEANALETMVDMSVLAKGFYSLTITMNDHSQKTVKVVKE